jgi:hypothetical protein
MWKLDDRKNYRIKADIIETLKMNITKYTNIDDLIYKLKKNYEYDKDVVITNNK